jgi:predicted outer membrane protein
MKKRIQKGGNTKDVEAAEAAYKTSKAAYDKRVADNSKALEGIFDKYIKYLIKTQELQKDFSNEVDGEIPTLKFEQFKDYKTVYSKYAKEMEGLINTYIDNEKKYLLKLINDTDYLKDLYSSKVGKTSLLGKLTPKQTAAKQDDEKYAREAALAQAREDASKKA